MIDLYEYPNECSKNRFSGVTGGGRGSKNWNFWVTSFMDSLLHDWPLWIPQWMLEKSCVPYLIFFGKIPRFFKHIKCKEKRVVLIKVIVISYWLILVSFVIWYEKVGEMEILKNDSIILLQIIQVFFWNVMIVIGIMPKNLPPRL